MRSQPADELTSIGPAIGQPRCSSAPPLPAAGASTNRPLTSRHPSGSHRRLVLSSVRQWVFLPSKVAGDASPPRVVRRSATARDKVSLSAPGGTPATPQRPRRPHTSRPRCRTASTCSVNATGVVSKRNGSVAAVSSTVASGELARVVHEAAQREAQQEKYVDPLLGRGVELRIDTLLPQARDTTATASNLREQHRAWAFQARARGDYHLAIQYFEKLLELSPSHSDPVFFHLAVAYERVGRLQDARATYQRAIASDPSNPFAYYNAGNIRMRMGNLSDAIDCYTSAIQHGYALSAQQQIAFYRQRGAAYRKNGEFEKAAQDYVWLRQEASGSAPRHSIVGRPRADSAKSQAKDPVRARALSQAQSIGKRTDITKQESKAVAPPSARGRLPLRNTGAPRRDYTGTGPDLRASRVNDEAEANPYDQWKHKRMLEITTMDPTSRSQDDLLFLADYLQLRFPFCAALHHEVCLKLCEKVVAVELASGMPVFCEHDRGRGSIYFVCHGRVSVYVTRVLPLSERTISNQDEVTVDDKQRLQHAASWETSYPVDGDHGDDSDPASPLRIVLESWRKSQMHLCDLGTGAEFGHQGRYSGSARSYSVIPASDVTLLALSWSDLLEVEKVQRIAGQTVLSRFLRMTTLFGAASPAEIDQLSLRARPAKIVGSKVLCTEGQFVGGLLVVKEGELCQLSPSGLPLPPNLSITFNLCGSLHGQSHEQERSAFEFFTQLEHADDPLGFLEISRVFHGFLPSQFLADRLATLRDLTSTAATSARGDPSQYEVVGARVVAKTVRRGEFFCASSSWVPFARAGEGGRGVSCAKTALVSRVSSEILFFSARDLSEALSPETQMAVYREVQSASSPSEEQSSVMTSPSLLSTARRTGSAAAATPFFLSNKCTNDLLEQARQDEAWDLYKQRLMQELTKSKVQRRQRRCQPAR